MDEYRLMRSLLEDVRHELGAIFESGLSRSGIRAEALEELAGKLSQCGLAHGGELAESMVKSLAASRLDIDWTPEASAGFFTELWRFTGFCLHRLEFLEARAKLSGRDA